MTAMDRLRSVACLAATVAATAASPAGAQEKKVAPPPPPRQSVEARKTVTVAVRGVDGIKGAKLINLETVLKLQHAPPPPPASSSRAAALLKGPASPTLEPPVPVDERQLLEEIPPDQIGGS